jgi:DNA-3-methyladenine glycosylase
MKKNQNAKLPRSFYERDTTTIATELLGKHLVRVRDGIMCRARIVETEAYIGPHDLASHSSKGLTPRTAVMHGPPGHVYVYLIYGIHHCMNVVTEPEGHGSAVLLRALEPVNNIVGNTRGPGLLCRALGIDKQLNGHDLLSDDFYIEEPPHEEEFTITAAQRVGVAYSGKWAKAKLRFYIEGNRFVSRP